MEYRGHLRWAHLRWAVKSVVRPQSEAIQAARIQFLAAFSLGKGPVVARLTPRPASWRVERFRPEELLLREYLGQTLYRVAVSYVDVADELLAEMVFSVA